MYSDRAALLTSKTTGYPKRHIVMCIFFERYDKAKQYFIFEQDEVHDFIFKRVGHEQMSLVPELLKLLVLEDEELWLQEHIRKLVSEDAGANHRQPCSDDMKAN